MVKKRHIFFCAKWQLYGSPLAICWKRWKIRQFDILGEIWIKTTILKISQHGAILGIIYQGDLQAIFFQRFFWFAKKTRTIVFWQRIKILAWKSHKYFIVRADKIVRYDCPKNIKNICKKLKKKLGKYVSFWQFNQWAHIFCEKIPNNSLTTM